MDQAGLYGLDALPVLPALGCRSTAAPSCARASCFQRRADKSARPPTGATLGTRLPDRGSGPGLYAPELRVVAGATQTGPGLPLVGSPYKPSQPWGAGSCYGWTPTQPCGGSSRWGAAQLIRPILGLGEPCGFQPAGLWPAP